ncbi:MAG: GatB/YqeY domain-containing protein [Bacilli bacterium]|jgi:uncharacterized protein YqeY
MSLIETLNADMKQAMRDQDKQVLSVIRMVKGAIQLEQINKQKELNDEEIIDVIFKQIKMRNESIAEFKKANRLELVEETEKEIAILNKYLPKQLTDDELEQIIDEVIKFNNFTNVNEMGKIMKEVLPKVKGKCDLGKVNAIIRNKLS